MHSTPTMAATDGTWRYVGDVRLDEDDHWNEPSVAEMGLLLERGVTAVQEGATTARIRLRKDEQDFVCIVVPGRLEIDVTYEVTRVETTDDPVEDQVTG